MVEIQIKVSLVLIVVTVFKCVEIVRSNSVLSCCVCL